MGTRNLTAVFKDGKYPVVQYCQWDGYPSGQGKTVLEFLRSWDRAAFEKRLADCTFITDEQIHERYKSVGADDSGMVSMDIAAKFKKKWPQLDRDMGADVLKFIQDHKPGVIELQNSIEFANDSLFCEFAYVVDLDANRLEVFKGFNTSPLEPHERFYTGETPKASAAKDIYYPIKLHRFFDLNDLPTEAEFLAACEDENDA